MFEREFDSVVETSFVFKKILAWIYLHLKIFFQFLFYTIQSIQIFYFIRSCKKAEKNFFSHINFAALQQWLNSREKFILGEEKLGLLSPIQTKFFTRIDKIGGRLQKFRSRYICCVLLFIVFAFVAFYFNSFYILSQ
eukprot:TRINITY_DN29512_c1_g1_i1.p2 TRINITY_DN29512_c1_g1~~TRINITY_DN29512_c1_g1_i1.p2  ORF type:complete len:137 (-),score=8.77 TRINITY_DN29512_c1_g1_i1:331-741(-)